MQRKKSEVAKWYIAMHALNDYTYFHNVNCSGFYVPWAEVIMLTIPWVILFRIMHYS